MDQAHAWTDDKLDEIEERVVREYSQALREIREKADAYFRGFEEQDKRKREQVDSGKLTEEQYKAWRRAEIAQGRRYRALINSLAETLTSAGVESMADINSELPEIYGYNHDYGTWEIESGTTIDTSYSLYSRDAVRQLMEDRQLYPEAQIDESKDVRWNRQHVNSALLQGILQGESMADISKRLVSVAAMSATTAMRTARTAVTAAENSGRLDSFNRAKRLGIRVKKQWVATLDTRTRASHRRLDMESVETDEPFSNGLMFPGDPDGPGSEIYNCRCAMISDLSDYPREQVSRYSKLNGMSYDEWRESKEQTSASEG